MYCNFQDDLDNVINVWNNHRIRRYANMICPAGRPALLYRTPQLVEKEDHLMDVPACLIQACKAETGNMEFPCDESVYELCCLLMVEHGFAPPATPSEAIYLYLSLREKIFSDLENIRVL